MSADISAAKFERIRKAHQSEVMEDYVEMIADLIDEIGQARQSMPPYKDYKEKGL